MNRKNSGWILLASAVALFFLAPLGGSRAWAEQTLDGELLLGDLPEAIGDSPLVVPFAEYQQTDPNQTDCIFDPISGNVSGTANVGNCCLVAPIRLPDGASIVSFLVYFRKTSSGNLSLQLMRKRLGSLATSQTMATVSSSGFGPSTAVRIGVDISIDNPVVDNSFYSYFLSTGSCLADQTLSLYSASISFN